MSPNESSSPVAMKKTVALGLGALGVVFGDIGTSPLYALRECFSGTHGIAPTPDNIMGVLSLIVWSLVIVVTLKYLYYVMNADNRGEGGIMALMALAFPETRERRRKFSIWLGLIGLFGAALLYGDGVITPAITVLSAIEGLGNVNPDLLPYSGFISIIIIATLFSFQQQGTHRIGFIYGPIMLLWFFVIGILGIVELSSNWSVIKSVNPIYAIEFVQSDWSRAFIALASVFLVATGAEALYADMGHFGRKPIKLAWLFIALPGLLLNYFGQAALLLKDPTLAPDLFFSLAPKPLLIPLVILATLAAITASQALISGVFSMTQQAIQLGYCPRLRICHTSTSEVGQIYIPYVNWAVMVMCIFTVFEFKTSSALAGAYGIAVSATMVITTLMAAVVARRIWQWSKLAVGLTLVVFLGIDLVFLAANITKIAHGGWFPITMGIFVFTLMSTWKKGRRILALRMRERLMPFEKYIKAAILDTKLGRVNGTAVFMNGDPDTTPPALLRNVRHNHVVHDRIISLSIVSEKVPVVRPERRVEIFPVAENIYKVRGHFGFVETPEIKVILEACKAKGLELKLEEITFFLGKETIIASGRRIGMAVWREKLFGLMARNAYNATSYFGLPADQVMEIGAQVEI